MTRSLIDEVIAISHLACKRLYTDREAAPSRPPGFRFRLIQVNPPAATQRLMATGADLG
jgi:hypothetical protein